MLVYDSLEQARMRLRGAVITYRDIAVYVADAYQQKKSAPIMLQLHTYPRDETTKIIEVDVEDPDLNFRVFKVGYLNDPITRRCSFLTRATRRQQTQGLVIENLGGMQELDYRAGHSKAFEDMLFERYPTIEEAMNRLNNEKWTSVAISRVFALACDPDIKLLRSLMYRGRRVGVALGSSFSEFLIDKKDEYLKEVLTEAGFPFRVE